MAEKFTFSKRPTVVIKGVEYTLAPRTKAFVLKLEEIKGAFQKPGITLIELLEIFHKGIDVFIGEGSFDAIFSSEENADIDEVAELHSYLAGKYKNIN